MKSLFRLLAIFALTFGTFRVSVTPAFAAPNNDTFSGATLAAIGFSETLDTTSATTDSDDIQLNSDCAPATDASVWYVLQGTDQGVLVDVSQSNYSAGVLVGVGSQGNFELIACGPSAVGFFAAAGTTYYILAFDDQLDGSGNGGELKISMSEIPPPPTVDITVNPNGTVNARSGVATISGTYTCTNGDFIDVFGDAKQRGGRAFVLGSFGFSDQGTCDGVARNWSADVFPINGKFAGGKSMAVTFAFSCGVLECSEGYTEQTVQLRGNSK